MARLFAFRSPGYGEHPVCKGVDCGKARGPAGWECRALPSSWAQVPVKSSGIPERLLPAGLGFLGEPWRLDPRGLPPALWELPGPGVWARPLFIYRRTSLRPRVLASITRDRQTGQWSPGSWAAASWPRASSGDPDGLRWDQVPGFRVNLDTKDIFAGLTHPEIPKL